jgi:hypothetical protein
METDKMILRYVYDKTITDSLTDVSGKVSDPKKIRGTLIYRWPQNKGTGFGVFWLWHKVKLSFNLWQYTTVLQAEVYAIKACLVENLYRNYRNRNVCIRSAKVRIKLL